ncbi:MAG: hypothetical protein MK085_00680 [Phycisphaerales bacterium]|nr:hypothetical protein [Phycisphaerales bacterium]
MIRNPINTLAALAIASSTLAAAQDAAPEMNPFKFDGGPLPAYLDQVKEMYPDLSLVVYPGGLDRIEMPPMEIMVSGPKDLLEIAGDSTARGGQPGSNWEVLVDMTSPIGKFENRSLYVFRPIVSGYLNGSPRAVKRKAPLSVKVYDVSESMDMQQVLEAISAGLGMTTAEDEAEPTVRFHEKTGLIFVEGDSNAQGVVSEIVARARLTRPTDGFGGKSTAGDRIMKLKQEYEATVAELRAEIAELKNRLKGRSSSEG